DRAAVLVRYDDAKRSPALVESRPRADEPQSGKVLLFTTPFDAREPRWNDYLESRTSFYIGVVVGLSTIYLVGETDGVQLNFLTGQGEPVATLPLNRPIALELQGPGLVELITAPEGKRISVKQAASPGNYALYAAQKDSKTNARLAAFSVNV